jgi:hypothetical protein
MASTYKPSVLFSPGNRKSLYSDWSFRLLILSNLIIIIWALIEGWSVGFVMLAYLSQNFAIGAFWFLKILTLKEFSTKDFTINEKPVGPTIETKLQVAFIFLVHYGMFNVMYSLGLKTIFPDIKLAAIFPIAIIFFVYQFFSFFYNKKWDIKKKPNIGSLWFFPYIRILPMHLSFIVGGYCVSLIGGTFSSRVVLAIFMLLKTSADVYMHAVERKGFGD